MFNLIKTRILYQFDHNYRAQKHKNSPNSQNNKMNLFTKLKVEFDKKKRCNVCSFSHLNNKISFTLSVVLPRTDY